VMDIPLDVNNIRIFLTNNINITKKTDASTPFGVDVPVYKSKIYLFSCLSKCTGILGILNPYTSDISFIIAIVNPSS
jgi:hypothetical protein